MSKKILSLVIALALALGAVGFTAAEETAATAPIAYLMYADGSWTNQYWYDGNEYPGKATLAEVTGAGTYTVGIELEEGFEGLSFAAVGIVGAETAFPTYTIEITDIRVNGESIAFEKGYTSSDDGVTTRMNIYNEWVSELPSDARSFDGSVADAKPIMVSKEAFTGVKSFEVDFIYHEFALDMAYLMYADSAWANQYWYDGNEYPVTATLASIEGYGDYTVSLEFEAEAQGLAFAAVGVVNGEKTYPGAYLKINDIRVNGESVAFTKGYTASDDGVTTRMNLYNEWVSELPADARSFDGNVADASPVIVDKEAFAAVKTVEVDFSLLPVTDVAYFMYADGSWTNQYWYDGNEYPGKVVTAEITGAGTYTVGIELENEAQGLSFAAVGVANGEKTFNGYFINVTEVKVNGEAIELGKGFTTSDDGVTTRENLYNEWVSELPAAARRADGNLEGASAIIVNKDAFAAYKTIEVTFDYIYGKPIVKSADEPYTQEEADELLKKDYNAYIGVQSQNYVFRNMWFDTYGRDDGDNPGFFDRLTGWDADSNAVDYGCTFEDAVLTTSGEYSVSLTTGEMGFGGDEHLHLLFVSTDIPAKLVRDGFLKIDNVRVKFGDAATVEYTEIISDGEYVEIRLLNDYNQSSEPFGYTVPGADTKITVTFNVDGLTD